MLILVTGGDGYIGWPTALRIATRTDERSVAEVLSALDVDTNAIVNTDIAGA